jgi:hypothetical protein
VVAQVLRLLADVGARGLLRGFGGRGGAGRRLAGAATGVAGRFAWVTTSRNIAEAIGSKFLLVMRTIPPVWLYSAAGTVAFCYAALGALGAAFYRTLSFGRTSA